MRRGFKTHAEKKAGEARRALKLNSTAPLDPWAYAAHLKVIILDFGSLGLGENCIRQLTTADGDSWSAMTIHEGKTVGIVLNPSHPKTRQRNDLMHELSHVELGHTPARVEVSRSGLFLLSDYSDDQEQEADWYAAAFLVPRDGLFSMRRNGKQPEEIARYYGVSAALCEWRLRMTGVEIQLRRAGNF